MKKASTPYRSINVRKEDHLESDERFLSLSVITGSPQQWRGIIRCLRGRFFDKSSGSSPCPLPCLPLTLLTLERLGAERTQLLSDWFMKMKDCEPYSWNLFLPSVFKWGLFELEVCDLESSISSLSDLCCVCAARFWFSWPEWVRKDRRDNCITLQ